jgi:hypothetical protein
MHPTAFDNAKKQPPEEALKNINKKQPPEEAWKNVNPRHSTRSDTQKRNIERIVPQLEELIEKKKGKIPHSQIDKFRELQKYILRPDPSEPQLKDTHTKMKTVAQNIGHPELFVPRTDEPAPNETEQIRKEEETPSAMNQQLSPASLDLEFDKQQQDTNELEARTRYFGHARPGARRV